MDVEWLIHNLCFDDSFARAEVDIDLHDDDIWTRLIGSLAHNTSLRQLQLSRSTDYPMRSNEDLQVLFETISDLPELEDLKLDEFCGPDLENGGEHFAAFNSLKRLEVELSSGTLSAELMEHIASMPKLCVLEITVHSVFQFPKF